MINFLKRRWFEYVDIKQSNNNVVQKIKAPLHYTPLEIPFLKL